MLKTALWWTTMACNFKCAYCWQEQHQRHGELLPVKFIDHDKWVNAWKRLSPNVLDITGGEPFLLPNFVQIVSSIASHSKIAITTNLSHSLDEFINEVDPSRVVVITCSYHPSEYHKSSAITGDSFLGRCLLLKNSGYPVNVNCVAWPDQMYLIPSVIATFKNNGLRIHIDPYSPSTHHRFSYSQKQLEYLRPYVVGNRSKAIAGLITDKPVRCSGGIDHITVWQDGTAWRCLRDMESKINPLGNIFDESFALLDSPLACFVRNKCAGCDMDKVTVEEIVNVDA